MITVDLNRIKLGPGDRVLDIGCGTGRHACAIHAAEKGFVVAMDLKIKDLVEARKKLLFHDATGYHRGGRWSVGAADITRLPFPDGCFELVICSEVLEHVRDHRRAVAELARVLKRGRTVVVSVPRFFPEKICWKLSAEYRRAPGGHIRIYRHAQLYRLLEDAGLTPVQYHFAHSLHTPYWWLKCLVGPGRADVSIVNLYHRFLTWDIMKKPPLLRFLDRLFNPALGKSLVLYACKS
ncbi:MAG: SAM-dependent methyltransferase [Deltaproteobacteria bacterium]|nr:MAG: SAM-dependent methyltransferase [Deltaproteobacteria bacterium]